MLEGGEQTITRQDGEFQYGNKTITRQDITRMTWQDNHRINQHKLHIHSIPQHNIRDHHTFVGFSFEYVLCFFSCCLITHMPIALHDHCKENLDKIYSRSPDLKPYGETYFMPSLLCRLEVAIVIVVVVVTVALLLNYEFNSGYENICHWNCHSHCHCLCCCLHIFLFVFADALVLVYVAPLSIPSPKPEP